MTPYTQIIEKNYFNIVLDKKLLTLNRTLRNMTVVDEGNIENWFILFELRRTC